MTTDATTIHPLTSPSTSHPPMRRECVKKGWWLQIRSPYGYEWNRLHLPIEGLPPALEGFTIVHLTDTHLRSFWARSYDRILEQIEAVHPHVVLFTGDFVENKVDHRPAIKTAKRFMSRLHAQLGTFGIVGNHDGDLLGPRVPEWNMTLLGQHRLVIHCNDHPIELIGLPGVDRSDLDERYVASLPPRQIGVPRIAMCHFPDLIRKTRSIDPDLYLAGHTHGGQICPPNGVPLLRHDTLPPRMCTGVHRYERTWLVVNRGMGFSGPPVRLFCPSEIIEIRLTAAKEFDAELP